MSTQRLEAFSDAVIAIIMTIMVLELKVPHDTSLEALKPLIPVVLSYVLSFVYLAIYWNNHHHMLHVTKRVTGSILWANMGLLFWLSLIPFTTGWLGENRLSVYPTAVYGFVLLMAAISYFLLQSTIVKAEGSDSALAKALGKDVKGKASVVLYVAGIVTAFVSPIVSIAIYVFVALVWLIPDKRIESRLGVQD